MKKTLLLMAIPCALLCAADNTDKKTVAPAPKPAAKAAAKPAAKPAAQPAAQASAPKIPAGAQQVEPYLYRYQDADGKKWLYRETPFGIVKMEDKPPAVQIEDKSNPVTATEEGDTVKFQRKTPFGVQSWTRKKVELTDEEKTFLPAEGSAASKDQGPKTAEKE